MRTSPTRPDAEEHDDFMKPQEAAADIGCGVRWLKDGAYHGGFPHHRFGRSLQFSRQDRDAIRKLCRVPAQPAKLAAFRKNSASAAGSSKTANRRRPAA